MLWSKDSQGPEDALKQWLLHEKRYRWPLMLFVLHHIESGPVHTGRASRFAWKFASNMKEFACKLYEHSH